MSRGFERFLTIVLTLILCAAAYVVVHAHEDDDLPVADIEAPLWHTDGYPLSMTLKRLVIVDESANARIILRTIDGEPAIILLRRGEREQKALLDFKAQRTVAPRSIVGGKE